MIPIFICEDDPIQRQRLTTIISQNIMIEDYDMEIKLSTNNPYDILDYLSANKTPRGIYFLDIDLEQKIDGIQLGSEIRKQDMDAKIVFITTHSELLSLTFTYKIEAMDYIIKDQPDLIRERIHESLERANTYHLFNETPTTDRIKLQINNQTRLFEIEDILFFETSEIPHKICMHLTNSSIEFYSGLNDVIELSEDFLRVHKSFVVNINNVTAIDKKNRLLTMKNGSKCPVSVRGLKLLK